MGKPIKTLSRQKGISLFVALIALLAMTLSGIALMRSLDTGNVVSANFAFKESTLHATDIGTENAIAAMPSLVAGVGTTQINNKYYPTRQPSDSLGLPTSVDWSSVPISTTTNGETVQYVVERMCDAVLAASGVPAMPAGPDQSDRGNVSDYCETVPQCTAGTSINTPPICIAGDIDYRVTSRVSGPHNTVRVVQTMVSM